MTIVEGTRSIPGGVDTHLDAHVAAALDDIGGLLGVESSEASAAGNQRPRRHARFRSCDRRPHHYPVPQGRPMRTFHSSGVTRAIGRSA